MIGPKVKGTAYPERDMTLEQRKWYRKGMKAAAELEARDRAERPEATLQLAREAIVALREALRQYGSHTADCPTQSWGEDRCECGLAHFWRKWGGA